MCGCVNEKCDKDPMDSRNRVLATPDADFACCPECLVEFKKQRDKFFNNISNDAYYKKWWSE